MRKVFSICFLLLVTFFPAFAEEINHAKIISAETLKKMIDDKANLRIIDSRREKDYWEEHIEAAVSLPATDTNAQTLDGIVIDLDTKLVFYCQNLRCQASTIAASKAIGAGYKYVYEFSGGLDEWKKNGFPTQKLTTKGAQ